MFRSAMIGLLLPGVLLAGGHASAAEILYRIACPVVWPGPGGPDIPLTNAYERKHWEEGISPVNEADFFKGTGPGDVQVDCIYGKGGQDSPLRITMILPGYPVRCLYTYPLGDTRRVETCEVRSEADGTLGPVRWRIAEQIGPETAFLGFGLGKTPEEIRAAAATGGFFVAAGEDGRLAMTRGGDQLTARFDPATGRSVEIAWMLPADRAERAAFHNGLIFRFGYNYRIIDVPGLRATQDIWRSADDTIAVVTHAEAGNEKYRSLLLLKLEPGDPRHRKPAEVHP